MLAGQYATIDERRPLERVVADQQRAVEIRPVGERGQLRGGGRLAKLIKKHDVSVMQPSMTLSPSARAVTIIACASRIPVHFISLTLMPS